MNKNGANGINFCFFRFAQMPPNMHENINAIANPVVPSHNPATLNNFISPIPIGVFVLSLPKCSNSNPIMPAKVYPVTAPTTDSVGLQIQGKKNTTINPINNKGKRYASGMILRRKSAIDMRQTQKNAPSNNNVKNV